MKKKVLFDKIQKFEKEIKKNAFAHLAITLALVVLPGATQMLDEALNHTYKDLADAFKSTEDALNNYVASWGTWKSWGGDSKINEYDGFIETFNDALQEGRMVFQELSETPPTNVEKYRELLSNYNEISNECSSHASSMLSIIAKLSGWQDQLADSPTKMLGLKANLTYTQVLRDKLTDLQNEMAAFSAKANYSLKKHKEEKSKGNGETPVAQSPATTTETSQPATNNQWSNFELDV